MNTSQRAIADAKRNKLLDVYAGLREAAKAKQAEGRKKGGKTAGRGRPKDDSSVEIIPPSNSEPKTRDIRAAAVGTNPKYIDLADRLVRPCSSNSAC
jgi:hypothetical protein